MAKQLEKQSAAVQPDQNNHFSTANHRSWFYAIGSIVVLAVFFLLGAAVANHRNAYFSPAKTVMMRAGRGYGMHERGLSSAGLPDNSQTRSEGVVTAVSGSDFTIAGQGSTTNVTTNSSTKYQNGDSVKQNDTVIVFGSISNNTLTATQVIINP